MKKLCPFAPLSLLPSKLLLLLLLLTSCHRNRQTRDQNLKVMLQDYKQTILKDSTLTPREKQAKLNEVKIYETTY
jgi:hypothetical protein